MLNRTQRLLAKLGAVMAAAIVAGASAAIATDAAARPSAALANHCTRYAPAVDSSCSVNGQINGQYITPSYAWRDDNHLRLTDSRQIDIALWTTGGAAVQQFFDFGTTLDSPGYGGGQTKAYCNIQDTTTFGRCWTNWHD